MPSSPLYHSRELYCDHFLFFCCLVPLRQVKEGDVVTIRGKGRVEVTDITVTKKGRYKIDMSRTT